MSSLLVWVMLSHTFLCWRALWKSPFQTEPFSPSLSKRASWIPWLQPCWLSWNPAVLVLVVFVPAVFIDFIQNENFLFIIQAFLPVSSKAQLKISLSYSFSLFPTRTHSGSSSVGWFLLEFMRWKHWVLYYMGQMHSSPLSSKIPVSLLEQYPQKV